MNLIRISTICYFLFQTLNTIQAATLKGNVTDAVTKEPLIGCEVIIKDGSGATTDVDGNYSINLKEGGYDITYRYLGYHDVVKSVSIAADEIKEVNVALQEDVKLMDETVVTGSVFEKKVSEEVISIEVIKPDFINTVNPMRFDDIARRVSGLNVIDGQANIRAGSGWSYGVGSRVMVIVDGQPFLSPDKFDVKWDFIPTETIGQIEVLKGASSVLYGSSAMNGTINIRTIKPTATPMNKFVAYTTVIGSPRREITKWWSVPRISTGANFARAHKVSDKFEYVVGANMFNERTQFKDVENHMARVNFSLRWNKNENLIWGLKGNFISSREQPIFWWQDMNAGAYRPGELDDIDNVRVIIDPFVTKYSSKGVKHDLKNRLYILKQRYGDKPLYMINNDYQVSKEFDNHLRVVGGASAMTLLVNDKGSFGEFISANFIASFLQVEKKWNKISAVAGTRVEMFRIQKKVGIAAAPIYNKDKKQVFVSPGNWRLGLNYNPVKNSFFRLNWGQAFRFPSLAERYATAEITSINIYPNPNLRPEYGWTGELGFKQHFTSKGRKFTGTFDVALFWQEYNDLVEFVLDTYVPDSVDQTAPGFDAFKYLGFKSVNISRARIAGYELTWNSDLTINGHRLSINAGYMYSYPMELNNEESDKIEALGDYLKGFFKSNFRSAKSLRNSGYMENVLKFRNRHLFTADLEWSFKGVTLGVDARYFSYPEKIDDLLNIVIKDLGQYRMNQDYKGDVIIGARAFYQINKKHNIGVIVKNVGNNEYYLRPPKLEAPINYTLQYRYEF